MRLASAEQKYSVGDKLPNGEEVIELRPIKHGSEKQAGFTAQVKTTISDTQKQKRRK